MKPEIWYEIWYRTYYTCTATSTALFRMKMPEGFVPKAGIPVRLFTNVPVVVKEVQNEI